MQKIFNTTDGYKQKLKEFYATLKSFSYNKELNFP